MAKKVLLSKSMCPTSESDIIYMKQFSYREAVGKLLWLAIDRGRPTVAC